MPGAGRKRLRPRRARLRPHDSSPHCESEKYIELKRFWHEIAALIRTTRIAGGLLLGYNPWKAGARLKTPAFTLFRPYCP